MWRRNINHLSVCRPSSYTIGIRFLSIAGTNDHPASAASPYSAVYRQRLAGFICTCTDHPQRIGMIAGIAAGWWVGSTVITWQGTMTRIQLASRITTCSSKSRTALLITRWLALPSPQFSRYKGFRITPAGAAYTFARNFVLSLTQLTLAYGVRYVNRYSWFFVRPTLSD